MLNNRTVIEDERAGSGEGGGGVKPLPGFYINSNEFDSDILYDRLVQMSLCLSGFIFRLILKWPLVHWMLYAEPSRIGHGAHSIFQM